MSFAQVQEVKDQVVLVTGSSRGLGRAIAEAFLSQGATVVINYAHREDEAKAMCGELLQSHRQGRGGRPTLERADVTDPAAVAGLFERVVTSLGRPITTVVHNALLSGFTFNGDARPSLDRLRWEDVQRMVDVTLKGALHVVQAAVPGMQGAKHGRIIHIGSNLVQNPVVPYHDYTLAKGALLAFTRTMAKELGPLGIRVNMVSGGLLRTTEASAATPAAVFDAVATGTPLGHVTTPQEVADVVLFLAHPWSRGVTGQNLIVDGGLVMQ